MSANVISTFFLSVSRILRAAAFRFSADFGLLETVRPLETVALLETEPVLELYDDTPAKPDALNNWTPTIQVATTNVRIVRSSTSRNGPARR